MSGQWRPGMNHPTRYPEHMARKKHFIIAAGAVLGVALIASQLGGDEPSAAPVVSAPDTSAAPVATTECVDVPTVVADNLAQAADATKASKAGAVKSPASESWLIAVGLTDGPAAGEVAVFETVSITEAGASRAVNGMAKEFTGLSESSYTVADDVVDEAIACMK